MITWYFLYGIVLVSSFLGAMDDVAGWQIIKTYNFGRYESYALPIIKSGPAGGVIFQGYRKGRSPVDLNVFLNECPTGFERSVDRERKKEDWMSRDGRWRVELQQTPDESYFTLQSLRRIQSNRVIYRKEVVAVPSGVVNRCASFFRACCRKNRILMDENDGV